MNSSVVDIPKVSWNQSNQEIMKKLATQLGVVLFSDLPFKVPMIQVRETFIKLYQNTDLAKQLNEVISDTRLFDNTARYNKEVDQAITLSFAPLQLQHILAHNPKIVSDLGREFQVVVEFFNNVKDWIIPRLLEMTAVVITGGFENSYQATRVKGIHYGLNYQLKLVDYLPNPRPLKQIQERRQFSTFTIIFQDKVLGGFESFQMEQWVPVPTECEMIFLWGWSACILSNARVAMPPLHRVTSLTAGKITDIPRRFEVVFEVAPDSNAYLLPQLLSPRDELRFDGTVVSSLTVQEFFALFATPLQLVQNNSSTSKASRSGGAVNSTANGQKSTTAVAGAQSEIPSPSNKRDMEVIHFLSNRASESDNC